MKKLLIILLKVAISLGIMAFLVRQAWKNEVFGNFWNQPKNWWFFALATACCLVAVLLTFVRWCWLVRTAGMAFPFRSALRLGFLGYLFNLAPLGMVGGDLLKAVMLAFEQRGNQAKAVATVLVDRIIGLYVLFVFASAAILLTGLSKTPVYEIRLICQATLWITLASTVGVAVLFVPWFTDGSWAQAMTRLPRVGHLFEHSNDAIRLYRNQPRVLLATAVMTLGVHGLFATGVYCVSRALPGGFHSLATHYVIMPVSCATGVVPLPLGPFEVVFNLLYSRIPISAGIPIVAGQGFLVALGYRCVCLLIAAVGICYYLAGRREVAAVMHEAQREADQAQEDASSLGLCTVGKP